MTSFHRQFGTEWTCLDDRADIGPHHLAIGKTRKLFEVGDAIEAFFSEGYRIGHARLDTETLALRETNSLSALPVAWGGGAFCIDADDSGRIVLVFVHRNRREFCAVRGTVSGSRIEWADWKPLLATRAPQAAPWVEMGPDGTAWSSVLSRDGDFRLAIIEPNGRTQTGPLFSADEEPWYHSCVQVLPISADDAVAVGFRGAFPTKTELVFKTVTRELSLGPSQTLAPCNVNDQFTFHFQAVGDPGNGRAHIAYLDEGLSVSHAVYERGEWRVSKSVIPVAAFAPQICLDETGRLALLASDYDGMMWTASWDDKTGWTESRRVVGLPVVTMSGLFGRTGYGTGGMICAARSRSGRVPFLIGAITDESSARAKLYAASLGRQSGLLFASDRPISISTEGSLLKGEIRLASLHKTDFEDSAKSWVIGIPAKSGQFVKLTIAGNDGRLAGRLTRTSADGSATAIDAPVKISARFHNPFSQQSSCAAIAFEAEIPAGIELNPADMWAETYDSRRTENGGAALIDLAPFEPEAAARTTLAPHRIPAIYKRMI